MNYEGRPLAIKSTTNQRKEQCGLQLCRCQCHHSFSFSCLLEAFGSENCEITRNSDKIWPYSSSRSSKAIDLGVNRKRVCDFLVINSNFGRKPTVCEILTLTARKWPIFHTPPLFDAPALGEPLRISGWNLPRKTKGMGLPYDKNLLWPFLADRTNGRAYATVLRLSVVCLSVVVCDVMYCG